MADNAPAVRGRYMKSFVLGIELLPPADRDRVFALISPDLRRDVERCGGTSWLPADVNLTMTHAVAEVLDPEQTYLFFRDMLTRVYNTSLLQSFVQGIIRMAGLDPARLFRHVGRGMRLMFREFGDWEVTDTDESYVVLTVTGLPEPFASDAVWLDSVRGGLASIVMMTRREATAQLLDYGGGQARYRVTWGPTDED